MADVIQILTTKRQPLPPGCCLTEEELSNMIDEVAEEIGWFQRRRHLKIVKKMPPNEPTC